MGIIGAVTNVGISFIASKVTGQDYGWKNVLEDAVTGALCAIPITSMIKTEKNLKTAAKVFTIVKAGWFYVNGRRKGYSSEMSILYVGANMWLETPNFSGIANPVVWQDLLKQVGLNSVYELGFSSLRSGVNAGFDMASGKSNNKKAGNQSKSGNKPSKKWTPPVNSGYKNGIVPIPSPIECVLNMSHLKK